MKKRKYKAETTCYLGCDKFNGNVRKFYKIRDHCHHTGKYRSAAYSICNLRHKENSYFPIVARNAYGFDNLIIPKITETFRKCEFLVKILKNMSIFSLREKIEK